MTLKSTSLAESRPHHLLAVVGTQTEVGKTWFAAQLLSLARSNGILVAARKPAQSFAAIDTNANADHKHLDAILTDAEQLAIATGEAPLDICPAHRSYPVAMAPPMAADVLRLSKISIRELCAEILWPSDVELGVVETAGGIYSPIAHDGDNLELLALLAPDSVVLVADAGLGTINAVRLSLHALGPRYPVMVFLNRFDADNDLHRRNREWLQDHYHIQPIVTVDSAWQTVRALGKSKHLR